MNTTNSAVATGIVVMTGRWAEGKGVDLKVAIGATVFALGLSLMASANQKLAEQFGLLVLVAAALRYTIPITRGIGFNTSAKDLGTAKK